MAENLVACGGMDCSVCSVLATVQNVFNFLLEIAAAVAILADSSRSNLHFALRGRDSYAQGEEVFEIFFVGFLCLSAGLFGDQRALCGGRGDQ